MQEFKVTRQEKDYIRVCKERKDSLVDVLIRNDNGETPEFMRYTTPEEIASIWLGIAELKPELVEPWEAYKAYLEGKPVYLTNKNKEMERIVYSYDSVLAFHPDLIETDKNKFYIKQDE